MSSNYPNGFANGVTIRGVPLVQSNPGEQFWVNNSTALAKNGVGGSDGNKGTYREPFGTVDYAIGKCTASRGDIIFVMPGYTETISAAAGWACDVEGVTIVGLGSGTSRPTITFDTATTADIDISVDNFTISNIRCVSDINSLVNFIDSNNHYATLHNITFVTANSKEAVTFIDQATTKDGLIVSGCKFLQPTDPDGSAGNAGTGAIFFVDSEDVLIEDCKFIGNFETAIIHNRTTKILGLTIRDCEFRQELSTGLVVTLVAASEGVMERCYGATPGADDVSEAKIYGVLGVDFWISRSTSLGNDSGGGGQGSVSGVIAT